MEKGEEKSGNHGLMDLIKWPLTSIKNRILYCVQANYGAWARRTFFIAWACARLPGSVKLSGLHPNTVSRRAPSQASCVQVRIQTCPRCATYGAAPARSWLLADLPAAWTRRAVRNGFFLKKNATRGWASNAWQSFHFDVVSSYGQGRIPFQCFFVVLT